MKADENENTCMMKKKQLSNETEEDTTYSIKFGKCGGGGGKWLIREVGVKTSSSRLLLTFSPVDTPDLCLDVKLNEYEDPIAVLRKCRGTKPGIYAEKQVMFVKDFGHANLLNPFYIVSNWSEASLLGTGEEYTYLEALLFQDPDNFSSFGFCRMSQFKIPNGVLKNTENLPFFLDGHPVTIVCEEGFGV